MYINVCIYIIQFSSATKSCLTLCDPVYCITLGFPVHHQLLELAQTHVPRVSDACCALLLPSNCLSTRVLNESVLRIRWTTSWSFSFNTSPSNEYSGLISFRIDWLISLQSKRFSRVLSNTTVQENLFLGAWLSLWYKSHIYT